MSKRILSIQTTGLVTVAIEFTILEQERQLRLHKTKTVINEIKAVKLCRNHNLKDLLSKQLASYISEVFDHLLQLEKHMFSVVMRRATQNLDCIPFEIFRKWNNWNKRSNFTYSSSNGKK